MRPTKKNVAKNLLERFSCSIVKRGKKISGHKILLKSLLILRNKNEKTSQIFSLSDSQNKLNKIKQNTFSISSVQKSKAKLQRNFEACSTSSKLMSPITTQLLLQKRERNSISKINEVDTQADTKVDRTTDSDSKQQKKLTFFVKSFDSYLSSYAPSKDGKNKKITTLVEKNNQTCQRCAENVKVALETRKVRKGRVSHKVPIVVNPQRQEGKAVALLIKNGSENAASFLRKNHDLKASRGSVLEPSITFSEKLINHQIVPTNKRFWLSDIVFYSQKKDNFYSIKHGLAEEFFNSANLKGISVEHKKQFHNFALQNRASLHFKWW